MKFRQAWQEILKPFFVEADFYPIKSFLKGSIRVRHKDDEDGS